MARRRDLPQLNVRRSFEITRISAPCLADAYERLAPTRRRPLPRAGRTMLTDEIRTMPDRDGSYA